MTAASTPSIATALASMPPSRIAAMTTARTSGMVAAKIHGASWEWATIVEPGSARKGQKKAITPIAEAIPIANQERTPRRTARGERIALGALTAALQRERTPPMTESTSGWVGWRW